MGFVFKKLELKGAFLITNFFSGDCRGGFEKNFEKDIFLDAGIDFNHNETFVSRSAKNVIRGLHFQTNTPQAKLVSVTTGSVWDVIVDLRIGSDTFGKWHSEILSADNHLAFYIPRGFAHGFLSLEDDTVMLYQCDGKYNPESDTGIRFDDPDIDIEWPTDTTTTVHSERDLQLGSLKEYIINPMRA